MLTIKKSSNWKLYWGVMPLPAGAEALGIVSRETGTGALIRLANGNYVQGNAGGIRNLPKHEVEQALQVSNAAAALGSIKSEKKAAANRDPSKANKPPKEGKNPRGWQKGVPRKKKSESGDAN